MIQKRTCGPDFDRSDSGNSIIPAVLAISENDQDRVSTAGPARKIDEGEFDGPIPTGSQQKIQFRRIAGQLIGQVKAQVDIEG
jgi:hypothetical protein